MEEEENRREDKNRRQDKNRIDKTRQEKARQDRRRQDKTRQDKTRQDKTRQDKTQRQHKKTRQWKLKMCDNKCVPTNVYLVLDNFLARKIFSGQKCTSNESKKNKSTCSSNRFLKSKTARTVTFNRTAGFFKSAHLLVGFVGFV